MAAIELEQVRKVYDDGTVAVAAVDLEVSDGELLVLVGPSGCGKSTLLRMIAGLEEITDGTIRIGGRVVDALEPRERDVAMVFQNYALYPHMSVYDNLAFALKLRRQPKDQIDRSVREAAHVLGLTELLERKPRALSGGQRQRVAMGRAIVREPQAFLMDEPLSNLDAKLRVQMRAEISRIQSELGVTTVYVTHDQVEAMTMGDRVAVMRKGVLQQLGTPQELYDAPHNLFVAGFIGSPAMNLVEATLVEQDGRLAAAFGQCRLDLPPAVAEDGRLDALAGSAVVLGIRPEAMSDAALAPPEERNAAVLRAVVRIRESLGADVYVHVDIDAPPVVSEDVLEASTDDAADVGVLREAFAGRTTSFVARLDPRSTARQGEPIELSVETDKLYFFDPSTGRSLRSERRTS
jgi:multiple sugar transport system ATP-binding protein